jgi:O-antigen ligase
MIFVAPWEEVVVIPVPGGATIIRAIGYFVVGLAALAVVFRGSLKRTPLPYFLLALFVAWAGLTLAWSLDSEATIGRDITYLSNFVFSWLIYQFMDSQGRQRGAMLAYILGCSISLLMLYLAVWRGDVDEDGRYSIPGMNPNELAIILSVSIVMLIYLWMRPVGRSRLLAAAPWVYIPTAGFAVLLTGSRAGILSLAAALGMSLVISPQKTWKSKAVVLTVIAATVLVIVSLAPVVIMERLQEGTEAHPFQVRVLLWQAGLAAFVQNPLFGSGAGTAPLVNYAATGFQLVSHNSFISHLVELGLPGFLLYNGAILLILVRTLRAPRAEKALGCTLLATWLFGALTGTNDYQKLIWFLIGLMSAQASLRFRAASFRTPAVQQAAARRSRRLRPTT